MKAMQFMFDWQFFVGKFTIHSMNLLNETQSQCIHLHLRDERRKEFEFSWQVYKFNFDMCIASAKRQVMEKTNHIEFNLMLRFHLHPCECRILYPSFSSVWVVFSEYYMCFRLESLSNSRDTSVSPYWFVWNWFPSTLFQWNFWPMN